MTEGSTNTSATLMQYTPIPILRHYVSLPHVAIKSLALCYVPEQAANLTQLLATFVPGVPRVLISHQAPLSFNGAPCELLSVAELQSMG
jgi:hypothetical protein